MATITFRFKNTGTRTLYLHTACTTPIKITSMADGAVYENGFYCACECASPSCTSQPACGACLPPSGEPIDAGSTKEITWSARVTTTQTKTGSFGAFQCLVYIPIPTGAYKVGIDVYASTSDAASETNSRTVEKGFTLGTANATIEVPLQ
jgi:hypothetical protein